MPLDDRAYEALAAAIAISAASLEDDDLARSTLLSYIADDNLTDPELLVGFMNLSTTLLVKLEKAGQAPSAILQDVAERYRPPSR